jgi:Domain of unknown function DUF11
VHERVLIQILAVTLALGATAFGAPAAPDVKLLTSPVGSGIVGEPIVLSVKVSNNSTGTASGLTLVNELSAEATFRSSDPGGCRASGRTISCGLPDLGPGQATTMRLVVVPRQVGTLTSQVSVVSGEGTVAVESSSADIQPRPVLGQSVYVLSITGTAFVRRPTATQTGRLVGGKTLPVGTFVDTRRGKIRLRSVRSRFGRLQTADFFEGAFTVEQRRGVAPVTEILAVGGSFAACPAFSDLRPVQMLQRRSRVRRMWGSGTGRFRTSGRYAAATVRGTVWLTEDRCNGTLIFVRRGVVTVFDRVRKTTVVLRSGQAYFAKAPGAAG